MRTKQDRSDELWKFWEAQEVTKTGRFFFLILVSSAFSTFLTVGLGTHTFSFHFTFVLDTLGPSLPMFVSLHISLRKSEILQSFHKKVSWSLYITDQPWVTCRMIKEEITWVFMLISL